MYNIDVITTTFQVKGVEVARLGSDHPSIVGKGFSEIIDKGLCIGFLMHTGGSEHYYGIRNVENEWVVFNEFPCRNPVAYTITEAQLKHRQQNVVLCVLSSAEDFAVLPMPKDEDEMPQYIRVAELPSQEEEEEDHPRFRF